QLDPHHGAHPRKHDRTGPGAGGGVLGAGGGDRLRGYRRRQPAVALLPCSGLGLARQRARRLSMRGAGVSAGATGVRVEGLSKRFHHRVKGDVWAVRGVSLSVQPGEFLTLLGPSGCGKTTTLRMIAGFESPDEGRVWIGDRDVTALMANRRDIGFVFQSYALFPHLTVFDNVTYGLRIRGVERGEAARRVSEVLAMVGLERYEGQQPHQLSGGEQQRVALARAIVIRPRVLLFDEPLSNLDAKLRVQMRDEIRRLQKNLAITTVYVTHDQEEAMA